MSELAVLGGPRAITREPGDLFSWPIVTREDEEAVLDVLRRGAMSGTDVTVQFEEEFARWMGVKYALAYPSGTESIRAALWACGIGAGDEVISSSMVIWAGCSQALAMNRHSLADIDPSTLCLDPKDVERHIGSNTRPRCGPLLRPPGRDGFAFGNRAPSWPSCDRGCLPRPRRSLPRKDVRHAGRCGGNEHHVGQGTRGR